MWAVLPSQVTKDPDVPATKTAAIMEEPLLHCASQTPCSWEAPAGWPQAPGWAWSVGLTLLSRCPEPTRGQGCPPLCSLLRKHQDKPSDHRPLPRRGAPAC